MSGAATVTAAAPPRADGFAAAGLAHLLARLGLVEQRVRRAVQERRRADPNPDDPFRGLYLSEERVIRLLDEPVRPIAPAQVADSLLDQVEARADEAERAGAEVRLRRLADRFMLPPLDVELLLVALAPDVDARFERFYGYLNDDVSRRRPTVGLALGLTAAPPASAAARARFSPDAPLAAGGLLLVEEAERPFLSRSLRVPDRVAAYLLGDDRPDPRLTGLAEPVGLGASGYPGEIALEWAAAAAPLAAALRGGVGLVYLREHPGGAAQAVAAAALAAAGRPVLRLDLAALAADPAPAEVVAAAGREARLRGAGLVAGPVDALGTGPTQHALTQHAPAGQARLLRMLAALPAPVLLTGQAGWDPRWARESPLLAPVPRVEAGQRTALWRQALDGALADGALADGTDLASVLAPFQLTPEQIGRAAAAARGQARLSGDGAVTAEHLRAAVRTQNGAGLERLARRIEPAVGWADLVLPVPVLEQLRELALRARHRDRVLGEWAMRPGGGRGRGVMALFAGDSGTGKTMSAEVVAADLGLDLYMVDLATVVDKYIGETEKNLERIFTEAAGVNGVLLFDEADAIFGKRSEVKDAHDRYANVESAYLLQRMESFDGIAVLTTNLRANLDEAFTRRLDLVVDFPVPDQAQRRALWDRCLGRTLPRGDDLDLDFCARAFELTGGSIRACAVTAAYLAAEADRPVTMADLVAAVRREYRKLGRLLLESEFGPYLHR